MPPLVSVSQTPPFLLWGLSLLTLAVLFILSVHRWRLGPSRERLVGLVAAGVALALVATILGNAIYTGYVRENSWTFSYSVSVAGSVFPDAVIVPSVVDERLLTGLVVASGIANWSFVETIHGRGLYIAFGSNATLSVYVSQFPPPATLPDAGLTLANETGPWPSVWIWHRGSAALSLTFSVNSRFVWPSEVQPGWRAYQVVAAPAPQ